MKYTPRAFQCASCDDAVEFLKEAGASEKRLYAAPTGVGKSIVEILVQEAIGVQNIPIVTPRVEIIDGILDKMEAPDDADGQDYNLWTPVTYRNRLVQGKVRHPKYVIYDETHHHEASTWQQLDLLSGLAPCVGYTASPYRGSPKSTRSFLEAWGDPVWLISYKEAISAGYIRMPEMEILPLVDDDIVDVRGGEFDVTSLDGVTVDRLGDLADHARRWYDSKLYRWDQPTIFACPTSTCCRRLHEELAARGMPSAIVSAQHSRKDRPAVFEAVEAGLLALIHINVVQEGVDLKLRRLVDLSPCLSPVKWVQQIGRIMRPWDRNPHYVCTNRNVMRHAYILEGVVPVQAVIDSEACFGPTQRAHTRVLGLEAIGRFKATTCKLLNGAQLYMYSLSALVNNIVVQYTCLVHPTVDPIWAARVDTQEDGKRVYGSWRTCRQPDDLRGFSSVPPKAVTDKQLAWWRRAAHRMGLDPEQEVDKKSFQALPVLSDLGLRFT